MAKFLVISEYQDPPSRPSYKRKRIWVIPRFRLLKLQLFVCIDINEILINKSTIDEKIKGYTNNIAYISAANSCRELKMASIYCSDNDLLSLAQMYMLSGKLDLLHFREAQPSIFRNFI